MKAVKGNKEYTVEESQMKAYQAAGYDIVNDSGEVVAYGKGKTVPFEDHMRMVEESKQLHARITELEAGMREEEAVKGTAAKKAGE